MYCISLYLSIVSVNNTALKITTNFSDDIHFLHAFNLKFTINVNTVYIPVELMFSKSIVCANHMVSIITIGLGYKLSKKQSGFLAHPV